MKLLGDKVAIKELPKRDRKENGLFLPDDHIQSTFEGEVVVIGNQVSESEIKVGSRVLVTIYDSSPKFRCNDIELRIYDTSKVIALLT